MKLLAMLTPTQQVLSKQRESGTWRADGSTPHELERGFNMWGGEAVGVACEEEEGGG